MMKKVMLLVVALIFGAVVMFGANPKNEGDLENKRIRRKVENLLLDPFFLGEDDILSTTVEFLVNQKGEVVVIDVDSEDERVVYFIHSRLNYQKVAKNPKRYTHRRFILPVTLVING